MSKKRPKVNKTKAKVTPMFLVAVSTALLAGILHATTTALSHKDVPFEMAFFIAIGLAQIIWAICFYKRKSSNLVYLSGLVINGSVFVVWLMSRLYAGPLGGPAEEFSVLGVTVGALELIAIMSSVAYQTSIYGKKDVRRRHLLAISVPILSGLLLFAGGKVTASVFNIDATEHAESHSEGATSNHDEPTGVNNKLDADLNHRQNEQPHN